jgi:pimeloyl-ACP methyl ester carboxylesterase
MNARHRVEIAAPGPRLSRRQVLLGGTGAAGAATLAAPGMSLLATAQTPSIPDITDRTAAGARASLVEVSGGVRLFVQDWGSGKPIVLVHGWPSSHDIFEAQALGLARRGYRVVALDLRGFGRSDQPWEGNDYDTWAKDIGAVLTDLDLRDVTLAGYSMGGAIALHYVATSQDSRVTKLALIAAAAPRLIAGADNPHGLPTDSFDGIIQGVLAERPGFFNAFIPNLFATTPSAAYLAWFERLVLRASLHATVRGAEEGRDRDLRPELGSIKTPTRIFHGIQDQLVPIALGKELQRSIAGATLVPFEQSGHGLFLDERDRLTDELAAFAG